MGRVYLPRADAESVGCAPDLSGPPYEIARLVALECRTRRRVVRRGTAASRRCSTAAAGLVSSAMAGIYRRLLVRIEREPMAVTRGRVSLPPWEKALVAARSLAGVRP